jgi:transposase
MTAVRPMLPNKPRGVPRVNDRRVLNGIFRVLRSGAPWRDLPESFGPNQTVSADRDALRQTPGQLSGLYPARINTAVASR